MDLRTYLRVLRKRWRIVVATVVVMVALASAYTLASTKTYQSTAQFFVSTSDSSDSAQLAQGSTFSQARVTSYTQLVTAPVVLQPVIDELKLPMTAAELGTQVSATVPPNTVLINVAVTDKSAYQAQRIAAALAQQFPKTVEGIERVSVTSQSPVKVTTTKTPIVNSGPVSPRPVRNVLLGLVLGLLLGIGLAVLRSLLDNRVRTKEDVEELSDNLTVIGTIPFDTDAAKHPLLLASDTHSTRSESFRSLRTNLRFVDAAHHNRIIVMTSALAGEGKTTTTANLALTLAENGVSVCLIEGDLRRPRLLDYLGLEGAVGLTDVLIERATLADVLQPYGKHRLSVLGAGQLPPNPSELLGSPAMSETLRRLSEQYDYVLIDAPPLLPVTDAAVLSTLATGAVVVVGSGLVSRDQLSTALESLRAVNGTVLGVALNRVPRANRVAGYYDYYSYRPNPADDGTRAASRAKSDHASSRK
ncbi:polysaccharide biosynthesis tyrosine autokinase [Allobranchiibius sp. CTAmp26]|uniref:polysaccharide biosynthesis tyrosine autokinase n=1 Tax=Allobranchiibius sp. CTAmp26 TaxID=2815214 RepID=UPI001AA12E74|nr:polysaccharide biosynthesis tyrosine autokinase [Allobranchiibius sp. CTAmp26]MBO1755776.1 polysaccharide biosynthesis tyrosine autokinase [Allobranchiibius sp. CTAmp26]